MDFSAARRAMIDSQLRPQAVTDPTVIAAMAIVPREEFVPAASKPLAYIDRNLPLGEGRALPPPVTLGRMLTELAPLRGEKALVVGAASGYAAAVLAEMGLDVVALENDPQLLEQLGRLAGRIRVASGELAAGVPDAAPFDIVLIDGQVEYIPDALIDQLKTDGRLGACLLENGVGRLVVGRRSFHGFGVKSVADTSAPPLPGFQRPRVFSF
ncbi:protein-L-isoaspartate O-methyltransferase [Sphingomonas sp. GCM10030256]|uniref:protein-L-isoaspartate O-methyltransferase family protein n=1 Tax=Sphingomonas sp. GCM10030256 TaxID=3273427 RepID=UPI00361EA7FC